MAPPDRLKLKARDAEDLQVLGACLQDAVIRVGDMTWLPREQRFVLVASRFRWEAAPETLAGGEGEADTPFAAAAAEPVWSRVTCGLCIERVRAVRHRNLDLGAKDTLLDLLGIIAKPQALHLCFAGGGELRLEVPQIQVHLEDLGEPWATPWRPRHALDGDDTAG